MCNIPLTDRVILIKGAGEMATGVACSLYRANLRRILMLETAFPLAVRRRVSFCEVVHENAVTVEGIGAVRVTGEAETRAAWAQGKIAVRVDAQGKSVTQLRPDVVVDAIIAKRNLGLSKADAPLVLALGPGFEAGRDCHLVVETNRGHHLARLIADGRAEENTGVPGIIAGFSKERVLRAPARGLFITGRKIGDRIRRGEVVGRVGDKAVVASIDGVLRGLIRGATPVTPGLKLGDIDPRGDLSYCTTISEKARALGGAVLGAVLARFNQ